MLDSHPLSPHLQIYRWQLTSVMSILHRLSGIALLGIILELIAGLYCLSQGSDFYTQFLCFLQSWPIQCLNIMSVFCLTYHFFNGIRHLFWDIGWGLEVSTVYKSGYAVLTLTLISSLVLIGAWYLT